jgi:hypothetical protein
LTAGLPPVKTAEVLIAGCRRSEWAPEIDVYWGPPPLEEQVPRLEIRGLTLVLVEAAGETVLYSQSS